MYPVSTTNVYMSLAVVKYLFILLNNHAQFQNIRGEEMSPIKKVMTQYVQMLLILCLTVYLHEPNMYSNSFVTCNIQLILPGENVIKICVNKSECFASSFVLKFT